MQARRGIGGYGPARSTPRGCPATDLSAPVSATPASGRPRTRIGPTHPHRAHHPHRVAHAPAPSRPRASLVCGGRRIGTVAGGHLRGINLAPPAPTPGPEEAASSTACASSKAGFADSQRAASRALARGRLRALARRRASQALTRGGTTGSRTKASFAGSHDADCGLSRHGPRVLTRRTAGSHEADCGLSLEAGLRALARGRGAGQVRARQPSRQRSSAERRAHLRGPPAPRRGQAASATAARRVATTRAASPLPE